MPDVPTKLLINRMRLFDAEFEINRISNFIRLYVKDSGANGIVLGISGGVDSAVVGYLSKLALGGKAVTTALLFEEEAKNSRDYHDAKLVIRKLGLRSLELPVSKIIDSLRESVLKANLNTSRLTLANMKARTRMILLYAVANQHNLLVAGTGDRSEASIGFFTKYGDGGADLLPIAHLYKTEVRELAKKIGVPKPIIVKPSSPNLWKGHKASDEIPVDYPILDKILLGLYDLALDPSHIAKVSGVPKKTVDEVMRLHTMSRHKRRYPPKIAEDDNLAE